MVWKVAKLSLGVLLFTLALRAPAAAVTCGQCASFYRACRNDCLNNAACLQQCREEYLACNCECGSCL